MMTDSIKQTFSDGNVACFAMTHAELVAPAKVYAEGYAFETGDDCVVGLHRALHDGRWILTAATHPRQRGRIDVGRIARSIDLNIAPSGFDQAGNDATFNPDDVRQKIGNVFIDRGRVATIELRADPAWTDQSNLDGSRG